MLRSKTRACWKPRGGRTARIAGCSWLKFRFQNKVTRKRALIGLDAANLTFIRHHLDALPALAGALGDGTVLPLRSIADYLAGAVWPTFYSGQLPGEHGIHHHVQWDAAGMRLKRVTNEWLSTDAFWRFLDRRGLHTIAFDVPMVHAQPLRHGLEIMSWGSHDQFTPFEAFPASAGRAFLRQFGRHPMGTEILVTKSRAELRRIKKDLIEGAALKGRAIKYLAQTHPWDLLITVFGECHRGGHLLWPRTAQDDAHDLLEVYQAVDRAVGNLLSFFEAQDAPVTLFALHGMGFNTSQEHFMQAVMERANAQFLQKKQRPPASAAKLPLVRLLREHMPTVLQNRIAQAAPRWFRNWVISREVTSGLDLKNTPGLSVLADLSGYIRFSIRGREASGWFNPGSPELLAYTEWLEDCFRSLRVPASGAPLVREVIRTSSIYPGHAAHYLPDLIVVWNEIPPVSEIVSDLLGSFQSKIATGRSGNHRPDGFVVVPKRDEALISATAPQTFEDLAAFFVRGL